MKPYCIISVAITITIVLANISLVRIMLIIPLAITRKGYLPLLFVGSIIIYINIAL